MKISKVIYFLTIVVGSGTILFGKTLWGMAIMFIGMFLTIFTDPELQNGEEFSNSSRKRKSHYDNEFEEYQHYKHCKRNLKK